LEAVGLILLKENCHSGLDPESSAAVRLAPNLDSRFRGNDKRKLIIVKILN